MTARLPRGVKLRRLQKRRRQTLLRAIRKLLKVKRLHRKHFPAGGVPFPINLDLERT